MYELDGDPTELVFDHLRHRWYGKYRGVVKDNNDPTHRGRLKVKVEAVLRDQEVWAEPCVPYAGKGVGFYARPEKEDGVWVEFEGGDSSYPIVTGFFWSDDQLPRDQKGTQASPPLKILRSKQGLMVALDDDGRTITLSDQNGKNFLQIQVTQGTIRIESTARVVVEAPKIELVDSSTHPVVFGDELMQYLNQLVALFNSHMHVGELALGVLPVTPAPPVAPFTPPPPSMLSLKVTSG